MPPMRRVGRLLRRVLYRCAQTGRFVTRRYAESNPKTTIRERR